MWRCNLMDVTSGLLGAPIDVPGVSWTLSVSDCSLATTRDKGTGVADATGLTVPWSAVPATTQAARESELASFRRGLVLSWVEGDSSTPIVAGAIGDRTDSWLDTSFDLLSPMAMLASRYLVREGTFGAAAGGTTTDVLTYKSRSLRAIASDIGSLCTDGKPGGHLPVDWDYAGEAGSHDRTYYGYNVGNNSCQKLLTELANVSDGPDMQLRPYLSDQSHLRWRFMAGSDSERTLSQEGLLPTLTCFPGGGTLQDVKVAHLGPTERVWGTGAGQDAATLCHLSEDLGLVRSRDPWPLVEGTASDTDWGTSALVASHADSSLAASRLPLVQLSGTVDVGDDAAPQPGDVWPGQLVRVSVDGFPSLPDGDYDLRLMEMSGDLTNQVKVTFDQITNPWYED